MTTTINVLGIDTVATFPTPTDLTSLVPIGDFLSANLANGIVINVDEEVLFTGSGLEAIGLFRDVAESFNTEGSNVLFGTEEDDILFGTVEADTMVGGKGDDLFIYQGGNDRIEGGAGDDILSFRGDLEIEDLDFNFQGNDTVVIFHEDSNTTVTTIGVFGLELNDMLYVA